MPRSKTFILCLSIITAVSLFAQHKDKGKFVEKKNEFWDKIKYENEKFKQFQKERFILDFEGMDLPKSKDEFITYWHQDPISQGNSSMCWCLAQPCFMSRKFIAQQVKK